MRKSLVPVLALGVVLAAPVPATAQTGAVKVNVPPTPIPAPESLRLRATSPSTFSGPCVPPAKITFEGVVEASAPIAEKYVQVKLIFSDAVVVDIPHADRTLSADRRTLTVHGSRSFERSFNGWAILQFQRNPDLRPHDSGPVTLKVGCQAPGLAAPKVPPPSTPGR
jgi:hypothetical protein